MIQTCGKKLFKQRFNNQVRELSSHELAPSKRNNWGSLTQLTRQIIGYTFGILQITNIIDNISERVIYKLNVICIFDKSFLDSFNSKQNLWTE